MRTKSPHLPDRMLDAAARLFGTQRFHEVRMDDIAAEARVSKGTLYRYFEDKQEMYLSLLAQASRQLVERLREAVGGEVGARDKLIALVSTVLSFFDARPHLFDLIMRAEALRGPGSAFPWQPVREEGVRMVHDIFELGRRRREFRVADPELAALMLLGGMRAVVRFGKKPRPRGLAQRIVDGCLRGLAQTKRLPKSFPSAGL